MPRSRKPGPRRGTRVNLDEDTREMRAAHTEVAAENNRERQKAARKERITRRRSLKESDSAASDRRPPVKQLFPGTSSQDTNKKTGTSSQDTNQKPGTSSQDTNQKPGTSSQDTNQKKNKKRTNDNDELIGQTNRKKRRTDEQHKSDSATSDRRPPVEQGTSKQGTNKYRRFLHEGTLSKEIHIDPERLKRGNVLHENEAACKAAVTRTIKRVTFDLKEELSYVKNQYDAKELTAYINSMVPVHEDIQPGVKDTKDSIEKRLMTNASLLSKAVTRKKIALLPVTLTYFWRLHEAGCVSAAFCKSEAIRKKVLNRVKIIGKNLAEFVVSNEVKYIRAIISAVKNMTFKTKIEETATINKWKKLTADREVAKQITLIRGRILPEDSLRRSQRSTRTVYKKGMYKV